MSSLSFELSGSGFQGLGVRVQGLRAGTSSIRHDLDEPPFDRLQLELAWGCCAHKALDLQPFRDDSKGVGLGLGFRF